MVGQEEMEVSRNMVRYKDMYFIFHHDQRLKQVPREVFESLSKMMLKIELNTTLPHPEDPAESRSWPLGLLGVLSVLNSSVTPQVGLCECFLSLMEVDKSFLLHLVKKLCEVCWKLVSLRFGEQPPKHMDGPTKLHFLRQKGPKQTAGPCLATSAMHMQHGKQCFIKLVI